MRSGITYLYFECEKYFERIVNSHLDWFIDIFYFEMVFLILSTKAPSVLFIYWLFSVAIEYFSSVLVKIIDFQTKLNQTTMMRVKLKFHHLFNGKLTSTSVSFNCCESKRTWEMRFHITQRNCDVMPSQWKMKITCVFVAYCSSFSLLLWNSKFIWLNMKAYKTIPNTMQISTKHKTILYTKKERRKFHKSDHVYPWFFVPNSHVCLMLNF